jgi:hypothetical protein
MLAQKFEKKKENVWPPHTRFRVIKIPKVAYKREISGYSRSCVYFALVLIMILKN